MTHFDIDDEVVVYYNRIEPDKDFDDFPEVDTTYAITLRTPANREKHNQP